MRARFRVFSVVVSSALALGAGCRRTPVTGPEAASPSLTSADADGGAAAASAADGSANQPPNAVFRTRPRADPDGTIAGGAAFEVTYNLCPSTDPDPGDELRFSFDFDGDGLTDERGSCRVAHRYEVGAYETGCTATTACVSDRQPEHKVCRTFQVCAIGRTPEGAPAPLPTPTPEPTPTPSPSPGGITQQTVEGDLGPIASRDAWAFEAEAGTELFLALDTLSAESAYLMQACVSTSSAFRDCLPPASKDRVPCSFPPPGGLGCPRRTTMLPHDGVYHVLIGGFRFTREPGRYSLFVRAQPGIGPLGLAVDDGDHPASVEP
jgi:hypothetical protein